MAVVMWSTRIMHIGHNYNSNSLLDSLPPTPKVNVKAKAKEKMKKIMKVLSFSLNTV